MQQRVSFVLAIVLIVHLTISLFFIFDPTEFREAKLSKIYKHYILPGPFFSEKRIIDNYNLYVSWKVDEGWSTPIDYAKYNFVDYQSKLNLTSLYRSRLEQTLYLKLLLPEKDQESNIIERKEFAPFMGYISERYLPKNVDSIRLTLVHKRIFNFSSESDSTDYLIAR